MHRLIVLTVAAAAMLVHSPVESWAQRPRESRGDDEEGDRSRGGFRGRGFPGGGFRGRGGFPGGGFPGFRGGEDGGRGTFGPGGFSRGGFGGGGFGSFNPADMLRRFDSNGNGALDPSETQGRARFFIERFVGSQFDLNRSIPLDRLTRAIDQRRGGSANGNRSNSESPEEASLVPGFGTDQEPAPPLGFGAAGEVFSVKVTDEDRKQAEERLQRSDRNRDGVLTTDELRRVRWTDDPLNYDRNHDGKLSASELAVRYAQRRLQSGDSENSEEADPREAFRRRLAQFGFGRGGGGDDEGGGRGGFGRGGFGRGGFGRGGFGRGRFGGEQEAPAEAEEEDSESAANERPQYKSYRAKTVEERLPAGLPDWFASHDTNVDGQVTMVEYASSWSAATVADFKQFDLNGDRTITANECLRAIADHGAIRGVRSSPGRSVATTVAARSVTARSTSGSTGSSATASSAVEGLSKREAQARAFYTKTVAKHDQNKDGVLTADEWSGLRYPKPPQAADSNGDGRLSVEELASFSLRPR